MAFIITEDHLAPEAGQVSSVGVTGPSTVDPNVVAALWDGAGQAFRMLDDDRELYYEGRFFDDSQKEGYDDDPEFQPLDCYGTPDSGCTIIQYRDNGKWVDL